jgi:hypothetical protein
MGLLLLVALPGVRGMATGVSTGVLTKSDVVAWSLWHLSSSPSVTAMLVVVAVLETKGVGASLSFPGVGMTVASLLTEGASVAGLAGGTPVTTIGASVSVSAIGAFVAATEAATGTLEANVGDVEGMTEARADTAGAPLGMSVAAQNGHNDSDSSQLEVQLPLHVPLQSTDVHVE